MLRENIRPYKEPALVNKTMDSYLNAQLNPELQEQDLNLLKNDEILKNLSHLNPANNFYSFSQNSYHPFSQL